MSCLLPSRHLEAVPDAWNHSAEIYADRRCVGAEREEWRNRRIARIRARVEQVFAAITQWGGKKVRTIGQARASFAMGMRVLVYSMRRLAFLAG